MSSNNLSMQQKVCWQGALPSIEEIARKLQKEFVEGKRIIYLAYRLFDYSDRLQATELEEKILQGVREGLKELGAKMDFYPIFFPYRDTLQHGEAGALSWDAVFEGDSNRLRNLFASINLLTGPSYDDGTGVELGYAVAFHTPTIIVINDALLYESVQIPKMKYMVGPIVDCTVGKILVNSDLHGEIITTDLLTGLSFENEIPKPIRSYLFSNTLRKRFKNRLSKIVLKGNDRIIPVVKEMVVCPQKFIASFPFPKGRWESNRRKCKVFLEFEGCKYEWQRSITQELSKLVSKEGYSVRIAHRFDSERQQNAYGKYSSSSEVLKRLGEEDLANALASDILVVCGDAPDVPFESSFLQGLCRGLGKKVVLYYSGNECWSEPPTLGPIIRNPMNKFSADCIVSNLDEIPSAVCNI